MFDEQKFKIALLRRKVSYEDIAKMLGISIVTLYRKINGNSDFYRREIDLISNYLSLDLQEKEEIFFANEFAYKQKSDIMLQG